MHKAIARITGLLLIFVLALIPIAGQAEVVVQVMSVQDEAAAEKEAVRLFDLGVPAFSRAEQVPELGVWNRVYIGPFETERDATVAAEALKAQGAIKAFVVRSETAPEVQASSPPANAPGGDDPSIVAPGPSLPLAEGEAAVGLPPLPVAKTPTYGEPVSPEQARDLGLATSSPAPDERAPLSGDGSPLQTYGEVNSPAIAPSGGLPEGLKPGDNMPGLISPAPPANPGSEPSAEDRSGQATESGPGASLSCPLALVTAPSAGEADEYPVVQVAQANTNRADFAPRDSMKLAGFTALVDLSSSMRRMSNCEARIKEEAVAALLRKMNRRIPAHPYSASLRVFGYKMAITKHDFTTLYYGPTTYNRDDFDAAIAKLMAADSVSPFGAAINAADAELQAMGNPKAVLMFSDFEESIGSGAPIQSAANARRRYGRDVSVYTFYVSRQIAAAKLAREIAEAGGGQAYDICKMLADNNAFEAMMMQVFGAGQTVNCPDNDGDGVCDTDDLCPKTPQGAPVDERGCWIAAYSQFFDFDQAVVKSAFLPRLKHAADLIKQNPNVGKVTIAGHTDNIGTTEYNEQLSRWRAESVHNLLVREGVAKERLVVEAYGATRPIAPNSTPEGRAKNRRVELHIGDMPPDKN